MPATSRGVRRPLILEVYLDEGTERAVVTCQGSRLPHLPYPGYGLLLGNDALPEVPLGRELGDGELGFLGQLVGPSDGVPDALLPLHLIIDSIEHLLELLGLPHLEGLVVLDLALKGGHRVESLLLLPLQIVELRLE